jgi:hypothetical protein
MRTKYSIKTMKIWILLAIVILLILWRSREPFDEENPPPVCPAGTILDSSDKCSSTVITPFDFKCPSGYEKSPENKCRRIDGTETTDPICLEGLSTFNTELGQCVKPPVDPTCPGGFEYKDKQCKRKQTSATSGTSTGGTSATSLGPNSGGPTAGRNRQVFGPVFTDKGDSSGRVGVDSSKTNQYPELLGGMPDTSTRIPGAGITAPSKNWTLSTNGSLPSGASLGTEESAKFFPMSRQPGDMDLIPDPYRVSQTFSASSYSSKTEPVPFLTDFSAFLK